MKYDKENPRYCEQPEVPERELPATISPERASAIRALGKKWVNGTVLHYYLFTDEDRKGWGGTEVEHRVVEEAFKRWKDLPLGLDFERVNTPSEAEIRIGFERDAGSWSFVGRDVLGKKPMERTMNFGWDISADPDTALHEIGHTLGLPHEHQNPNAGISWNKEAVYAALARPPNEWNREKTHWNILRKIPAYEVDGSKWDPESIMHYPFAASMILGPEPYNETGIQPPPGLSKRDKIWVQSFYPPQEGEKPTLAPLRSMPLAILPGQQRNFTLRPDATKEYTLGTFGDSDTVIVLFEREGNSLRYVGGDDDSGEDTNARLSVRLFRGREYVLRVRMYWNGGGETAVMMW